MWLQVKGLILHSRITTKYSSSSAHPCVHWQPPLMPPVDGFSCLSFFFFAFWHFSQTLTITFPLAMYSICFATVKSWKYVLSKHPLFSLLYFLHRLSSRQDCEHGRWKNHCLLNSLALEKPLAKCEWHLKRFCLLVFSCYKGKIKPATMFFWSGREGERFITFKKKNLVSTGCRYLHRFLKWDIDLMRLEAYSTAAAFIENSAVFPGSVWF